MMIKTAMRYFSGEGVRSFPDAETGDISDLLHAPVNARESDLVLRLSRGGERNTAGGNEKSLLLYCSRRTGPPQERRIMRERARTRSPPAGDPARVPEGEHTLPRVRQS